MGHGQRSMTIEVNLPGGDQILLRGVLLKPPALEDEDVDSAVGELEGQGHAGRAAPDHRHGAAANH